MGLPGMTHTISCGGAQGSIQKSLGSYLRVMYFCGIRDINGVYVWD